MLVECQNCQIHAKWLGCTGGATLMVFGSFASTIWPKSGSWFLLGHVRGMRCESGCNMWILCTKSYNNMVKNILFCVCMCVRDSVSEISGERGQRRRGKRIKHYEGKGRKNELCLTPFSASTAAHTHWVCNTFGIHDQKFGKSDSHILLILSPQECTL